MAQQTAVVWLIDQLRRYGYYGEDFVFTGVISSELIEQAKQIEKEQISQGYMSGLIDGMNQQPKEYYNETYGTTK